MAIDLRDAAHKDFTIIDLLETTTIHNKMWHSFEPKKGNKMSSTVTGEMVYESPEFAAFADRWEIPHPDMVPHNLSYYAMSGNQPRLKRIILTFPWNYEKKESGLFRITIDGEYVPLAPELLGCEVYQSPEFKALCSKFGIAWEQGTLDMTIEIADKEIVKVHQVYYPYPIPILESAPEGVVEFKAEEEGLPRPGAPYFRTRTIPQLEKTKGNIRNPFYEDS